MDLMNDDGDDDDDDDDDDQASNLPLLCSLIEMMMVDFQSMSYNISLKNQLNTRKVFPIQAMSLVNDIEGTSEIER